MDLTLHGQVEGPGMVDLVKMVMVQVELYMANLWSRTNLGVLVDGGVAV
jgi:hypothetical protein